MIEEKILDEKEGPVEVVCACAIGCSSAAQARRVQCKVLASFKFRRREGTVFTHGELHLCLSDLRLRVMM